MDSMNVLSVISEGTSVCSFSFAILYCFSIFVFVFTLPSTSLSRELVCAFVRLFVLFLASEVGWLIGWIGVVV